MQPQKSRLCVLLLQVYILRIYSLATFPPVRGEVVVRQLTHDDSFPCPDKAIFFSERRM
nr:MAG TPA: hypothetical protein [Caudoviricetes sp.]